MQAVLTLAKLHLSTLRPRPIQLPANAAGKPNLDFRAARRNAAEATRSFEVVFVQFVRRPTDVQQRRCELRARYVVAEAIERIAPTMRGPALFEVVDVNLGQEGCPVGRLKGVSAAFFRLVSERVRLHPESAERPLR